MTPLGPAVILVMDPPMFRPAGLVYRLAHGVGWLEPGYWLDEYAPRPFWHEVSGEVTETDSGLYVHGPQQTALVIDIAQASDYPEIARELQELAETLKARGTSLAEQRLLLAAEAGAIG